MTKKIFFSFVLLGVITLSSVAAFDNFNKSSLKADSKTYSLQFDDSSNKIVTSGDGSLTVTTEDGNNIGFTYAEVNKYSYGWGVIESGGNIVNDDAINGLTSITVNTTYTGNTLNIYYGFSQTNLIYSSSLTSGQTFDFDAKNPSFFKIVNETGTNYFPITSINLTYSCIPGSENLVEKYVLVENSADLKLNTKTVIASFDEQVAMSTNQKANNRGQDTVIKTNNTIDLIGDIEIFTLVEGTTSGTYAFKCESGYLFAASSTSNHLKTYTTLDANGSFNITITNGAAKVVASGANTRNELRYNPGSDLFSCYGSGNTQKDVAIYQSKLISEDVPSSEPSSSLPNSSSSSEPSSSLPTSSASDKESTYTGTYYNGIDQNLRGNALLGQIKDLIVNSHSYYTNYGECRTGGLGYADETDGDPKNSSNIVLFYTHASIPSTWDYGATFNREHVWCKNRSNDLWKSVDNEDRGPGSDLHQIRPEFASINSSRSDNKYADFTSGSEVSITYNGIKYVAGSNYNSTFEPVDNTKGDVARILLYMFTHYNSSSNLGSNNLNTATTIGSATNKYEGSLPITSIVNGSKQEAFDLLLSWNTLDPVDELEIIRNNETFKVQGNRNPFIDHPKFVDWIWG